MMRIRTIIVLSAAFVLAFAAFATPALAAPPSISSFMPESGPTGTQVVITGTAFTGTSEVRFNGVVVTSFTIDSGEQITATVPPGATTGPVALDTPEGTATSSTNFTVVPPPSIASFSPSSGSIGTQVVITGSGLTGTSQVRFNGTAALTFAVDSDAQVTAVVPSGASTGPIAVDTPGGTTASSTSFTVVATPSITSFSPTSGPVGTQVVISGSGFTGTSAVRFNGVTVVSFTVDSDDQISAIVPAGASTGPIALDTPGGTATSASSFTVTAVPPVTPPRVMSFSPRRGPIGTLVDVEGENLGDATQVEIRGVLASFTVRSNSRIRVTVPKHTKTGPIRVTTPDGSDRSRNVFDVILRPSIADFAPRKGPIGTWVKIDGSNLEWVTRVSFGDKAAKRFNIKSDSRIVAKVPRGVANRTHIRVRNVAGRDTTNGTFIERRLHHGSRVTLLLAKHLIARGAVDVADDTDACFSRRLISVQRRSSGSWRTIDRVRTNRNGSYSTRIPDNAGTYRVIVARKLTLIHECRPDVSGTVEHVHKTGGGGGGGGGGSDCTPGYSPCLPPASDYDCAGGSGDGPRYVYVRVRVTGSDPYGLDDDNDGYGCDTLPPP
jgi:hypothetical protein